MGIRLEGEKADKPLHIVFTMLLRATLREDSEGLCFTEAPRACPKAE